MFGTEFNPFKKKAASQAEYTPMTPEAFDEMGIPGAAAELRDRAETDPNGEPTQH